MTGLDLLRPRAIRTDDPVDPALLGADVDAVLDVLDKGGVAIIPTCLTYAVVAHHADAVARIFAAKARSYDKPCGLFGSPQLCRQLHLLPARSHRIIRFLTEQERLPFSAVAPVRLEHRFLARLEPNALRHSTKAGTMDMVISGGPFVAALAARSFELGIAVVGSSANRSLQGSKYRLADIENEVRDAADIALDYGVSRWATPEGLSSTIIDFTDFSTVRVGHCYSQLRASLDRNFGITLK